MNVNQQYKSLIKDILENGYEYTDKSRQVQCKQISSHTLNIDLTEGFPAISLKKLYWKGVVGELIWFLRGDTNIKYLVENHIGIWDKDCYNYQRKQGYKGTFKQWQKLCIEHDYVGIGNLGRIYGAQWRKWTKIEDNGINYPIDQITNLIKNLKENPMSRRHIVTAWNPAELEDMALPPCHWSFEIIVEPVDKIKYRREHRWKHSCSAKIFNKSIPKYQFTLKWHQRSVDTYLGLPFNIASYALLAHIIGKLTNMVPKGLIGDLSNVHLYENSWVASQELLLRDSLKYKLPKLKITEDLKELYWNGLNINDFELPDYKSHDNIPVEMLAPKN